MNDFLKPIFERHPWFACYLMVGLTLILLNFLLLLAHFTIGL